MTLHREIHLEGKICADLAAAGWLQVALLGPGQLYEALREKEMAAG